MKVKKLACSSASGNQPRELLSDSQWKRLEEHIPKRSRFARKDSLDYRVICNAIFWILRTGSPWRDLPQCFPKWQSVYYYFRKWTKLSIIEQIFQSSLDKLHEQGELDHSQWNIDGTNVRAHKSASGKDPNLGRSRGGWGSKIHVITDNTGQVLQVLVTAGQKHEARQVFNLLDKIHFWTKDCRKQKPERLAGDKAYDSREIRRKLRNRKIVPVIGIKKTKRKETRGRKKKLDKEAYKGRHIVENSIGWLKECRRVATRYDKTTGSFMSFIYLACIRRILKR